MLLKNYTVADLSIHYIYLIVVSGQILLSVPMQTWDVKEAQENRWSFLGATKVKILLNGTL